MTGFYLQIVFTLTKCLSAKIVIVRVLIIVTWQDIRYLFICIQILTAHIVIIQQLERIILQYIRNMFILAKDSLLKLWQSHQATHLKCVHIGKKFQCDYMATQKRHLPVHQNCVHLDKKFVCPECDYEATHKNKSIKTSQLCLHWSNVSMPRLW